MSPYSATTTLTDNRRTTTNYPRQRGRGCLLVNEEGEGAHHRERRRARPKGCDHHHVMSNHGERPAARVDLSTLDRAYAEILQEVRVAQTCVQVTLAFELTLAFTPKFEKLSHGQVGLYVATLLLGAVAASLLMAPAAFNRLVFRHKLRVRLVHAANRFALAGLTFLLATMGCVILLILQIAIPASFGWLATGITGAIVSWFVLIWFAVPAWWRFRHRECGSD
jgi:hypothetical protein